MARQLVDLGHEVYVLTGFPNYPDGRVAAGYRQTPLFQEVLDGVTVLRVPLYPSHDASSVRRIANYTSFAVSAALLGVPRLPQLDVLWVNYSPITLALPMWLTRYGRRVPVICEVADLWPDTLAVAGLRSSGRVAQLGWGLIDAWCKAMYASSRAVVHISPSAGLTLEGRGVRNERLHYIPKATNEEIYHTHGSSLRSALNIAADANVLLYAGAMGAAQDLGPLLQACAAIEPQWRPTVLLAGSGTQEPLLRDMTVQLGLSTVHFLGRVPEEDMTDLMATADVAYISLAQHTTSGVTMPSKTQAILASGKAIVVAGDGDVADLVSSRGVGFAAAPSDVPSIESALRSWLSAGRSGTTELGVRARQLYENEFSVSRLGTQVDSLVNLVTSTSAQHPSRSMSQKRKR
ncbi:glycosyltransferase WbuB [Tessaracoccus sp. ZS01]|nr:glycosyltransferase WbuB [Tessaracoccus sp. ZS01]OMG54151.1 hypothetical protein BJN44_10655 [Tessaracoccus sp. ZS01]